MVEQITEVVMSQDDPVSTATDRLVEYADKLVTEYAGSTYRNSIISLAKEARKEYEGIRETKKIPWEGSANYSMMVAAIIIDELECKVATLMAGKGQDIIEVEGNDGVSDESRDFVEGFGEWMLEKGVKWHRFIPTAVHETLLDGTVFVWPRYEEEKVKRGQRYVGEAAFNPATDEVIEDDEALSQVIASGLIPENRMVDRIQFKDSTVFRVVNDIYGINEVYGPDVISEWGVNHPFIVEQYISYLDLKNSKIYQNVTEALLGEETSTRDNDSLSLDTDTWQLKPEDERKLIKCYKCILPNEVVNEGDDPDWVILTYSAQSKTLLLKQYMRDVIPDNTFPVQRLGLVADGKKFFCVPLYQKIRHHAKAINDFFNQMIDAGTIEINPVFFFNPVQSGLKKDEVDWFPGAMNPCNDPSSINQIQTSAKAQIMVEYINLVLAMVERLVGVTSYNEGIQDSAMAQGAGTAAGMRMLLTESQTKRNYQTKSMKEALEDIISTDIKLYAWYMPLDSKIKIKGQMMQPNLDALQSDYSLSIRISDAASNDMLARLEAMELFKLASSLPFANQVELFKELLDSYQKREPDKYINPNFMFILQAVAQNPQVVEVVQQFMVQQQEAMKIQKMQQAVSDSMQRRDYLDQAQAAKIIQSAPDGFTPEEIIKALNSIRGSQVRDVVEASLNSGVNTDG